MKNKVLVTGAGGFIGSHLVESLVVNGYSVKVLLRYNSSNKWGWLESSEVRDQIEVVTGDVRDFDLVSNALQDCGSVFHLAALIGIPYSYVSPLAYIRTNIEGTYNVLEASKKLGIQDIIITSTSETYGTAQHVPIDEKHPLVGQSPYSATKIAADQLSISYYKSFSLPIKIVRPFNTFGPRQSSRAIIPTIISQILAGKSHIAIGNVNPTRDFTFVKDTVAGFIEIFKTNDLYGEVTNVGTNTEISIKDLFYLIKESLGSDVELIYESERDRPVESEVQRLVCDNSKILARTSWQPKFTLKEGLLFTAEWMKDNISMYKTNFYNV